jgi:hypothetical protein
MNFVHKLSPILAFLILLSGCNGSASRLGVLPTPAEAQQLNYQIEPVAPRFEKDAETTLLADFSDHQLKPEYSAGDATLTAENPQWVQGGGLKGAFSFAPEKVFNPLRFTVELLLRVPGTLKNDARLGGWEIVDRKNDYRTWFYPDGFRLFGGPNATRHHEFQLQLRANGNGHTVFNDAPGQWVYVAFGLDLEKQKAAAIVRDADGNVLANNINFVALDGLNRQFLKKENISEKDAPAAIDEAWREMAQCVLAGGLPQSVTLGNADMEILKLRVSSAFRDGVLAPQPEAHAYIGENEPMLFNAPQNARFFDAAQLLGGKLQSREATRNVGLPGFRNSLPMEVKETYVPLQAGDEVSLPLKNLSPSLYSLYLYGTVARDGREVLSRVWRPAPLHFELRDSAGRVLSQGLLLLKQGFEPRRMQGFSFHITTAGDYTAVFKLDAKAQETAEVMNLALLDQLRGLPDVAIKQKQNLAHGRAAQLTELTPDRKTRDDAIWNALPPLNLQMQVHNATPAFAKAPQGAPVGDWDFESLQGVNSYYRYQKVFSPLDLQDAVSGATLAAADVVAGKPWPGALPDDGTGIYLTPQQYPALKQPIYYAPRAVLLGQRYVDYMGAILNFHGSNRGLDLPQEYLDKGDPNVGHDAALALVRFAYDWPALEMNLHELRLSTQSPDLEYNTDWSASRNGKAFYEGWSGSEFVELLKSYDQLFPYINNNQLFADEVHRFIPSVKTPQDVVAMLDRYLVFAGVRDFNSKLMRAAPVEDTAAQVMGYHPQTARWFDLTKQFAEIYPTEGTYQEMYGTALNRNGHYYVGSYMVYGFGDASNQLSKAVAQADAKSKGYKPIIDLSDVGRYRKVRAAGDFLFDIFTAGGYPVMVGDASGGPHSPHEAERRLKMAQENDEASSNAFALWRDARHAWVLKNLFDDKRPEVAQAAAGVKNPLTHQYSRVVPNGVAVIEQGSDSDDLLQKGSAVLRLGIGQGHAHNDYLDLNIFGMGLPLAVDLAARSEGHFWSRPAASWTFLHNHAMAHDDVDPKNAGNRSGEPWLQSFAPPLLRAAYVSQDGSTSLDRDVLLMPLGDGNDFYVFDVQRLRGGKLHTWAFHGAESRDLQLNTPMQPAAERRWLDRLLEGTQQAGKAPGVLQATWTMTREGREIPHKFDGGGVIKTVAAEQSALGKLYDENRPPAHLRATLLGHAGDDVMEGDPYSQQYQYAFPFLWVQSAAKPESVYPAIYEYYRGDVPALKNVELVSENPLTVRVTTQSGQTDTFVSTASTLSAVSRDAQGVRWAKLSGGTELKADGLSLKTARAKYSTVVTAMDYAKGTLTTRDPLPSDPGIVIGNDGRRSFLQLAGSGTAFTFRDDLLIGEGKLSDFKSDGGQVTIESKPGVLFAGQGNRKTAGFTQTNEDGSWQFRGGKVIKQPAGGQLAQAVFTDANGDGFVNVHTYEAGLGDSIELLGDVTVRRVGASYEVLTNVEVEGNIGGRSFKLAPKTQWQKVG